MTGDQVDDKTAPEAEQETKGRLEGAYWRCDDDIPREEAVQNGVVASTAIGSAHTEEIGPIEQQPIPIHHSPFHTTPNSDFISFSPSCLLLILPQTRVLPS